MLTTHFGTKILPRIGPAAYGGEVSEGKHLGRTIRWTPQGFEWESSSKHDEDMMELCGRTETGLKREHRRQSRRRWGKDGETSMTHWTQTMLRLSDKLHARGSTCRSIIHHSSFVMSVVMSGMSEPKVVHRLQAVSVARSVLQHPCETWLFNYEADPKTLHVYTDTDWAADELTRKSVSCTVERYGSHMLDCSVEKQWLVALSSEEAEFYAVVRAVATSKQTSQILEQIGMQLEVAIASDSSAALGMCTTTGSGKVRHLSIQELWIQEAYRKKEFQVLPVDTLLNWADIGTKGRTSERLTLLLRQRPLRLKEGQTNALACLIHGGDEEDCDAWLDPEGCDECLDGERS